jgi:hypothetical protein
MNIGGRIIFPLIFISRDKRRLFMDRQKLCTVRNRNNGMTTYQLPELHIVRTFGSGEVKKVPYEELLTLYYAPGGEFMLKELLIIEDKEVLEALQMKVEPEYFYTTQTIRDLLLFSGYDEFADFLDFAPEGAIEIAKEIAVKEQIPDVRKREMITKQTGFDVNAAIQVNRILDSEDKPAEEGASKQRRVQAAVATDSEKPARRIATPPQYKVVSKGTTK